MFYTYVLKSLVAEKSYIGYTNDVERKLSEHNAGRYTDTRDFAPWKLIYKEPYNTIEEARKRGLYFRSSAGRGFIKNIWEIV